jgi:hypothetical protein
LGLLAVRKVRDILGDLLSQLLADSPEPELMRIHDKYADRSFADEQQQQFDAMRRTAAQKKAPCNSQWSGTARERLRTDRSSEAIIAWAFPP